MVLGLLHGLTSMGVWHQGAAREAALISEENFPPSHVESSVFGPASGTVLSERGAGLPLTSVPFCFQRDVSREFV